MTIQAVVFDLDGTLLNTLADIADAVNTVLNDLDCPTYPVDAYAAMISDGLVRLLERALPTERQDAETIQRGVTAFDEVYLRQANAHTTLYDGISELLDELTRRRLPRTILSNKPHELTLDSVAACLGQWEFHTVFGQRADVPRKPDPGGAFEIARLLNVSPTKCLYLGDTAVDMQTAIAAGMLPVGAAWGYRPAEELRSAGAARVVQHPSDVLELIHCRGGMS